MAYKKKPPSDVENGLGFGWGILKKTNF